MNGLNRRTWLIGVVSGSIAVALIFGYRIYHRSTANPLSVTITEGQLPECDSVSARRLLRQVIENTPAARAGLLQVVNIGQSISAAGMFPGVPGQSHSCMAVVDTNAGQTSVLFFMNWADQARTQVYLRFEEMR